MVFKSFKHIGEGLHDMKQYRKQIEVSTVASFLSNQYNKSTRPAHCGRVSYLDACVVEEKSDEHEEIGERRFCAEEPLPPGKFIKFSNNTGYWDESHLDETLLRFTLFTFEATGGYLMLTDLQGVKVGSDFVLTDPAVLCNEILRFGRTNLGEKFMKRCMASTKAHMKEQGW
eukprot:CAMPEP_0116554218 /NCGR_PEP_ID=MMETSP0397-20121206/7475_1 /TAXON_ID=216820 /ORGANISM="Cyclophora tenuis, Strain ECT3854" /LENGTH=171 /DNA_ID=CAMNT_0004079365 /DNA_START=14 /DNA_END=526 /DNA_ORIENTATION=-